MRNDISIYLLVVATLAACSEMSSQAPDLKGRFATEQEAGSLLKEMSSSWSPTTCGSHSFTSAFPSLAIEDVERREEFLDHVGNEISSPAVRAAFKRLPITEISGPDSASDYPNDAPKPSLCPADWPQPDREQKCDENGCLFFTQQKVAYSRPYFEGGYLFLENSSYCGPTCAGGQLLIFRERQNGRLELVQAVDLWIS